MHKRLVGLCLDVSCPDPQVMPEEAQCPVCLGHNGINMLVKLGVVLLHDAMVLSSNILQHLVVVLVLMTAGSQLAPLQSGHCTCCDESAFPIPLPLF